MELLILLWVGVRSKGAPAPRDAADLAVDGVRVGIGCPLSLMVVMAVIVMIIMVGTMAAGGVCDPTAATGSPNSCMERAFSIFEDATGLQSHDSMGDWWADPANPFR